MRGAAKAALGGLAAVATLGTGVAAFQIDDEIVTRVETDVDSLWVPAPAEGQIVELDPLTGDVIARVDVADDGAELDVAPNEFGVVVVDRTGGVISLVDPSLHEVQRTIEAGAALDQVDIGPQTIAYADARDISLVDPEVRTSITARAQRIPRDLVAAADTGVALVDDGVLQVNPDASTEPVERTADRLVRVGDQAIAIVGRELLDADDDTVACLRDVPIDGAFVAGHPSGAVAVTGEAEVHIADIERGTCALVRLSSDTGPLGQPVIAGDQVYVPEVGTGRIHIIDLRFGRSSAHPVARGAEQLRLVSNGELVAVYDQGSSFVALLGAGGVSRIVDTSEDAEGFNAVLGDDGAAGVAADDGGLDTGGTIDSSVLGSTIQDPEPDPEADTPPDDSGALVANFAFSSDTVTAGESVRFVDESSGAPNAWFWDFGDGTTAEGPIVEKIWFEPGTYAVTLTVFDDVDEASVSLAITVVASGVELPPVADFIVSSQIVNVGDPVAFSDRSSGTIETWRWDFGDGAVATTPDATHSWSAPGRYAVRLTVANEQGADSAQLVVEVTEALEAPIAVAEVLSERLEAGQAIRFSAESTSDAAIFTWDFGDGGVAIGPLVQHVFADPGTYSVVVTAVNAAGESTVTIPVVIVPATVVPVARIAPPPALIEVGDVVNLQSLSTNAPTSETWSFGDGTTAEGETVDHTWDAPGSYVVSLTAANEAGSDTDTITVDVVEELPPPVAAIGSFPADPWVGDVVAFTDGSINAVTWSWDFGNGITSAIANPIHTFTEAGPVTVTLTVTNRNGTDSTSVVVTPRLRPVAAFSSAPVGPTVGELVTFTDQSSNAVSWTWDFGDGTTSSDRNPTHTYTAEGEYAVSLTVRTAAGDADTTSAIVAVDPAPPVPQLVLVPAVGTSGELVNINATPAPGSGPIVSYELDLGDGSAPLINSTGAFTHTYFSEGTYTVRVRATGPAAVSDWVVTAFTVNDPPPPLVSIDAPATADALATVTLNGIVEPGSGPIDVWEWSFQRIGPGTAPAPLAGQSVTVSFDEAADYRIRLIAQGPYSSVQETQRITIQLPAPPTISAVTAAPNPAPTGSVVNFNATVSASVVRWEWDFEDDGTYVDLGSDSANWQHIYNSTGATTARLRVFDVFGQSADGSVVVNVIDLPDPTPIVVSPSSGILVGTLVDLSSDDANGLTGLTWEWRLTHPTAADVVIAGEDVQHTFTVPGTWTVTVTARDAFGNSGSEVTTVSVDAAPTASFTFAPTSPGILIPVAFTDTSSANGGSPITTWSWDFGDGGSSTAQNPSHAYALPGAYTVTLTVTSAAGVDQFSTVVNVSVL